MSKLWLRPLCWIEGHHWLLQHEEPLTFYDPEATLLCDGLYHYRCQRCDMWSYQSVRNLDNDPSLTPNPPSKQKKGTK